MENLDGGRIAESLPDRVKLDKTFDVERMRGDTQTIVSDLQQQFYVYYSPVPIVGDVASPPTHDWAREPMLKGCSYLPEMFRYFQTEITSVRLMRLDAGAELKEHTDPTLDAAHREVVRLTVPIISDDQVVFLLNGTEVPMKPGELWYMKLSERHSVRNNGPHERINMSIDVTWNPWVEDAIASCVS